MIKRGLEASGAFPATSANIDTMYGRAMQESGGDVNAVNNWDSNAAKGIPSKGLFQVVEPTWEANREGEFGPFSSNWNKGDASAGVAANYMKAVYGRIVGASGTGYAEGGLIKKEHQATLHDNEVVMPLNRPHVANTFAALGMDRIEKEMVGMRQDLKQLRVHVADFDPPATDKMLGSGENGTRRVMNSKEGANIVQSQNTKLTKRTRISG
jgi:SLT domain-containing protein